MTDRSASRDAHEIYQILSGGRGAGPTGLGADPALQPGVLARAPSFDRCSSPRVGLSLVHRWDDCHIQAYRAWVQAHAPLFADKSGFRKDCADWAMFCLISYARLHDLSVRLVPGFLSGFGGMISVGPASPVEESDWDRYEAMTSERFGAADFDDLSTKNCVNVPAVADLASGDLITSDSHVQLVTDNDARISAPDQSGSFAPRRVLEITQGNLEGGPGGAQLGTEIEHKAWDLEGPRYYVKHKGSWSFAHPREFNKEYGNGQWRLRRWNFAQFNG